MYFSPGDTDVDSLSCESDFEMEGSNEMESNLENLISGRSLEEVIYSHMYIVVPIILLTLMERDSTCKSTHFLYEIIFTGHALASL